MFSIILECTERVLVLFSTCTVHIPWQWNKTKDMDDKIKGFFGFLCLKVFFCFKVVYNYTP